MATPVMVANTGETGQCTSRTGLEDFWDQGLSPRSNVNGDVEQIDSFTFYSKDEFDNLPAPPVGHRQVPKVNNLIDFAACNWRISDDEWLPETRAESEDGVQMRHKDRETFVNVILAKSNRATKRETLLLWRAMHVERCLRKQLTTAEEENQALKQRVRLPDSNHASVLQEFCAGQSVASILRRSASALWMLLVTAAGAPAFSIFAVPFFIYCGKPSTQTRGA